MSEDSLRSLREYYRIGLTYTSNAIEGNSLTESETKVVIEDGLTIEGKPLRDVYEAIGHAKAYDFIHELSTEKPITESDILQTHKLFYQQIDSQTTMVATLIIHSISEIIASIISPSKVVKFLL